jgi:hypothetical protein
MTRALIFIACVVAASFDSGRGEAAALAQDTRPATQAPFDSGRGDAASVAQGRPQKPQERDIVLAPKNTPLAVRDAVPRGYALIVGIARYRHLEESKQFGRMPTEVRQVEAKRKTSGQ